MYIKYSTDNNKNYVSKTIVESGKNDGVNVEILSGINPGDMIVSEGIRKLVDNARVKIIN